MVLKTLVYSLFRRLTRQLAQESFVELSHPVKFRLCINMIHHMTSTNSETPGYNCEWIACDEVTAGCWHRYGNLDVIYWSQVSSQILCIIKHIYIFLILSFCCVLYVICFLLGMTGDGMCGIFIYLTGFWQAGGGANGRRVTRCGRVGAQQVVEGSRYISASVGGFTVVYSVAVSFSWVCVALDWF